MAQYFVEWTIEVEADSAEDAARKALAIQRDATSIATVFKTISDDHVIESIDVTEIDEDLRSYSIQFEDADQHSERNGSHKPVIGGAEFLAEYGDELTLDDERLYAEDIDSMDVGDTIKVHGGWGEVITVKRTS